MDSKRGLFGSFGKSPKVARVGMAFVFVCAFLFAGVGLARQAQASGTWYVKVGGNDANDCATPATACASINGALAKPGFVEGDTIKVAIGTYTGTGNEVVLIEKDVTLSGGWDTTFASQSGMSTVDGENTRRGITILVASVTVKRFSIQNGSDGYGGSGVYSDGGLAVEESIIANNNNQGIQNGPNGTMLIKNVKITNNFGSSAGGVLASGTVTIEDSQITDNSTTDSTNGSAITVYGSLTIHNSTISNNHGGYAAIYSSVGTANLLQVTLSNNERYGVYNVGGTVSIQNTILANNESFDCFNDPQYSGTIENKDFNLLENNQNCTTASSDVVGEDPLLAGLADNGGFTQTMALLGNSSAMNKIPPANCPLSNDQRGAIRPQGTNCDIGAYEATGTEPTATPSLTPTATATFTLTSTPSPTATQTSTPTVTPTTNPWTKVMSENFDKSFPRGLWKVYDGWGKSTCQKVSGNNSAWSVREELRANCNATYPNNSFNWMIYGPFNLSDAKQAMLTYNLWLNAELQKDVFFVGASVDGRRFYGKGYTGQSGGLASTTAELSVDDTVMPDWTFADLPKEENANVSSVGWVPMQFNLKRVPIIKSVVGKGRVWIGFLWDSDARNGLKGGGAYVDDVLLTKVKKR